MKHIIEHGTTFLHLSGPAFIENREPRKLNFWHAGRYHTIHQSEMRELLPYLQAFAETGALPLPPAPEKTPLERLLERVNAVPRPCRLAGVKWSAPDDAIRIRAVAHRAAVLLDRSAATAIEFTGATEEMREFLDYVDAVADIVRRHYDDEALCKVLNDVPGKSAIFDTDRWERKDGSDRITLGSGDLYIYVRGDAVRLHFTGFSDMERAWHKEEFGGYLNAISKALKEFHANSTR